MARWTLQPIFDSYLIVGLLTGLLLLLLLVKPRFPSADSTRQRMLAFIRLFVILLVALAMLRPTWIWSETKSQSATVVFLWDQSRSMSTPDVSGQSRWDAMRELVKAIKPQLSELGDKYDIRTYVYDSRATNIEAGDAGFKLPDAPQGSESDIGTALDDVLRGESGNRLAAVFLLGDGAQRVTETRVDVQQPVRELARRGSPLYTLSLGESRDSSQARDVAIENLPDQYTVFVNNELEIEASVRIEGYVGRNVATQLRIVDPDGETQFIGPIDAVSDEPNQQVRVRLAFTPIKAGQHKLTLIAETQPGEQIVENNELSAYLTVLDGGLRILYVDGNIGWPERKFIRRAIDESPDMQVDLWLDTRQDRSQPITLPIDDLSSYDVFLIGDIDSTAIGSENALSLATLVGDGNGLMMLGGVQSFDPGGYDRSPIGKALPIELDRLKRQSPNDPVRRDAHYDVELRLTPSSDHFLSRLTAPQENARLWNQLPPLQGANRFGAIKDQSQVLLQSKVDGQDVPVLVSGRFGLGRELAMAGDSTFRWYRRGYQAEHKRFWRQCMLWLAKKDDATQDDVWIKMPRRRFSSGEKAPFTVGVQDESGTAVSGVEFDVELTGPADFFRKIRVSPEDDFFAGISPELTVQGDYEYSVKATRGGQSIGETRGGFLVVNQDLELADPAANPQLLSALSQLTSEAGGRLLAPEELKDVLDELKDQQLEDEVAYQSKWQLADSTEDAGIYFGFLVFLLVMEWFLRKLWGLV